MDADKEEEITRQYIEMMDTKTPSQEQLIGNLSGGNQQKVMIGSCLLYTSMEAGWEKQNIIHP